MTTLQALTVTQCIAVFSTLVLVGYIFKVNYPDWTGQQWHFWVMATIGTAVFFLATALSRSSQ